MAGARLTPFLVNSHGSTVRQVLSALAGRENRGPGELGDLLEPPD